jgi:glutamyl-Q tRNA(Asp) synthetase
MALDPALLPIAVKPRGRFAPSPSGPLHFGSLVAALASWLDARSRHGEWLVRIEDLDPPREVPGAAREILHALDAFGLHWDAPVQYQSQRHALYAEALERLQRSGHVYPCACTRKEIADSALHGIDGIVYPGTCRSGIPSGRAARAWRMRTQGAAIVFDDELQGRQSQELEREAGDFVLKRADGLFAYQLAVVVDDADQGITRVVRGADLLASTPRQIHLQRALGLPTPAYLHVPVATDLHGEKLAKQTSAAALDLRVPSTTLVRALNFLGQDTPQAFGAERPTDLLAWATARWNADKIPRLRSARCP